MEHHKPHSRVAFEGYYSKFRLPSGANLALIICSVHDAKDRPYMVSVTYVPKDSKSHWQREYWPELIEYNVLGEREFDMNVPGFGRVVCSDSGDVYDIKTDEFDFHAETVQGTRTAWLAGDPEANPAGVLVHAPLPIQWHVQSLCTSVNFRLSTTSRRANSAEPRLHPLDQKGEATVHQEKNWASSFPPKYIWVQAWDPARQRGLCIAGGVAMPGVEAYLMTYTHRSSRGPNRTLTFTPPWTFSLLGFRFFCHTEINYKDRTLTIDVSNFFRRIKVSSSAAKDTFFTLSAPMKEGHRSNFCCESFAATHHITIYERTWPWSSWTVVETDQFTDGSLEYGGDYYDDAGKSA